jgi:capsular polysaccharide biosynthesis protein
MVRSLADSEFIPILVIKRIFSYWWIMAVMAILGGIFGWAFHFLQPPVYEATAELTVMMDFTRIELTQYEQDYAFSAVGGIIDSSAVKDQMATGAQAIGISITQPKLFGMMFSEGKQSVWELHVRDQDPKVAADLANLWAQVANDDLNAALSHAIQSEQLQAQIDLLSACLPIAPGVIVPDALPRPTPKDCGRYSLTEIQTELKTWTDELVQEQKLTLGVLPTFEFAQTGYASIPETPILYNLASLTLAGAMIGFVISFWVAGSLRVRSRA